MTLTQYRRYVRAEDAMIRLAMPRIAASDPSPLVSPIFPAQAERRVWRAGRSAIVKSGWTLAEVARG